MSTRAERLASLLIQSGLSWIVQEPDSATQLIGTLDAASQEWQRRSANAVDLLAECESKPAEMEALIQMLAEGVSFGVLVMAARILLEDVQISEVRLQYHLQSAIELVVTLVDDGGAIDEYRSQEPWDAYVLRHLGMMKVAGKPVFAGCYPLFLGKRHA